MDNDLVKRLARFERRQFPKYRIEYRRLVADGQHPRTQYEDPGPDVPNLNLWLDLARPAALPVTVSEEALRRAEQQPAADAAAYQLQ